MGEPTEFKLLFDGPIDDRPETIQKLKGIFIADLELSIEQVRNLLESYPSIIKSSPDQNDLSREYHLIKNAGGKVLIVAPEADSNGENVNQADLSPDLAGFELEDRPAETSRNSVTQTEHKKSGVEDELAIDFSIDDSPYQPEVQTEQPDSIEEEELLFQVEPHTDSTPSNPSQTDTSTSDMDQPLFQLNEQGEVKISDQSAKAIPSNSPSPSTDSDPIFDLDLSLASPAETEINSGATASRTVDLTGSTELLVEQPGFNLEDDNLTNKTNGQMLSEPNIPQPTNQIDLSGTENYQPSVEEVGEIISFKSEKLKKRRSPNLPIPLDLVGAIIAVGIILGIGNWYYFKSRRVEASLQPKTSLVKSDKPEAKKEETSESEIATPNPKKYEGTNETDGVKTIVKLILEEDQITSFSLELVGPKPAPLGEAEYLEGKVPLPWLSKALVDFKLNKGNDNEFSGNGQARLFVEDQREKKRLFGEAKVIAQFKKDRNQFEIRSTIRLNLDESLATSDFLLERVDGGGYRSNVRAETMAGFNGYLDVKEQDSLKPKDNAPAQKPKTKAKKDSKPAAKKAKE